MKASKKKLRKKKGIKAHQITILELSDLKLNLNKKYNYNPETGELYEKDEL